MAQSVFDLVLDYLSFRPRTEKEVRDYLERKKYDQSKIDETIEKLKYYHYIDDHLYTQRAIENNAFGDRFGKKRLKQKLWQKGIDDQTLKLVDEIITQEDERAFLEYHLEKIKKKTEGLIYSKRINRINSYLMRRGFNYSDYSSEIYKIDKNEQFDNDEFEKHLSHYQKMYTKKGFSGRELEQRIIKAMLSRGYKYEDIKSAL